MPEKSILVEIRSVYGNRTIYPLCDDARAFAAIAGTSTLTARVIQKIKALGYAIEVAPTFPARL